jgi:hypothetical protein
MNFTQIPTEQTTAITDLLLGIVALWLTIRIRTKTYEFDKKKALIWISVFGCLAIAALIGTIAHGIEMSKETNLLIWHPVILSLGLTVALFAAGAIYDLNGFYLPTVTILILLLIGIFFFIITLMGPGSFLVFIIYEALAMIFALVTYTVLTLRKKIVGGVFMIAGVIISLVASVIQTLDFVHLTIIWPFDHNGLFHVLQIVGMISLFFGVKIEIIKRLRVN